MTLEDGRNIATIVAAVIGLAVYITNSVQQHRQRVIENATRFITAHRRLFDSGFLFDNWRAIEDGTFHRDIANASLERDFAKLLGEIEYLAILEKSSALSKTLSIYMFGWWAQRLQPLIRPDERNNVYWEVAIQYLDSQKSAADDFYKLTKEERQKYHRKRHFAH